MPRSRAEIPEYMERTGRTDQHKGAQYRCRKCGGRYWTAWGWAWRHNCDEEEGDG